MIHKDILAEDAEVTVQGSYTKAAEVMTLSAKDGPYATSGVSYAGQTFDGTTEGSPSGSRVTESVSPSSGSYSFVVKSGTAAVLAIPLTASCSTLFFQ